MEREFAFSFALYAKGQNLLSMRYHFLSFLVFAAVPIANADATSKAVNETFSGYTDALASDDGAKAVDLLSSASKAYMENLVLRSLGLSPDSPGSNAIWKPLE